MFKRPVRLLFMVWFAGQFFSFGLTGENRSDIEPFDNIMIVGIKSVNNTPVIKTAAVRPGRLKNRCRDFGTVPIPGENTRSLLLLKNASGVILYKTVFDYPVAMTIPPHPGGSDTSAIPDVLPITEPETHILVPYFTETATMEIYNPGERLPQCTMGMDTVDISRAARKVRFSPLPEPSPVEDEKLHILIMAGGYDETDMETFSLNAAKLRDFLLTWEPFQTYASLIEVHIYGNTEDLECHSGCNGIARLLCCNTTLVIAAAAGSGYLFDEIVVIHNTDTYCGGGYRDNFGSYKTNSYSSYAATYSGDLFKEVGVHEFGHSFGNLCDEYTYGSVGSVYFPCVNCREFCSDWASITDVCLESCDARNNFFRPGDSIMLNLDIPYFNDVSIFSNYGPHGLERRLHYFTGQETPVYVTIQAERKEERAWIVRKDYGELTLTVENPNAVPVLKYIIYRGQGGGEYEAIREIPAADLQTGEFSFLDEFLDKDTEYTYKAEVVAPGGRVIEVSSEETI